MKIIINAVHRVDRPTGVCRYSHNLALDLAELKNVQEVILLIGKWQEEYFNKSFKTNSVKVKIKIIDINNNAFSRNTWFLFGLPKIIRQLNGNLLHLAFPVPIISKLIHTPTIVTVHDLYPFEIPENFGYPRVYFNRLFLYISIKFVKNIICVSQTTKKALIKYFPEECKDKEISVIYNKVKFSSVEESKPNFISGHDYTSYIFCNSQHRKNKNIPVILKSFSELILSKKIDAKTGLIILGSKGPESENLAKLVDELKIENNVLFTSLVSDAELAWLYKHCSLFISASSIEGFCIPLVEAMLFSANVVCSDIPIFREIGNDLFTYFTLDSNAIINLSRAIESALASKSLHRSYTNLKTLESNISYEKLYKNIFDQSLDLQTI